MYAGVHVRTHTCVGTHRYTPPPKVHPQPRTRPHSYVRDEQYTPTHTTQPHKPPPHPTIGGTLRHLGAILSAQLIRWGSVYQSRGESRLKRLKIASCTYAPPHTPTRSLRACARTHSHMYTLAPPRVPTHAVRALARAHLHIHAHAPTRTYTRARLDLCAHTHARTRQILGTKKAPQGGFKVAVAC